MFSNKNKKSYIIYLWAITVASLIFMIVAKYIHAWKYQYPEFIAYYAFLWISINIFTAFKLNKLIKYVKQYHSDLWFQELKKATFFNFNILRKIILSKNDYGDPVYKDKLIEYRYLFYLNIGLIISWVFININLIISLYIKSK